MDQVDQGGWKNRPNPRGRVTHPALGSLSCVLADGAGADVPGGLEDGRQGSRALHVTHDRVVQLPKVSRLLTGVGGRGLDGTAGIRPRHGGVVRRRLGHRPSSVRRIHPPGHACVDRTAMQVRRTCRMHESEVATEVEGEHAVSAKQQARHVIVGRYDEPPRPLFAPCSPVLVVLPHLPSIPLLPPRPPLPSRPRLSPLSAACLLPSRIAIAMSAVGDGGAHRHAARCPLLPPRSVPRLQHPLCCRLCLPAASVSTRIPPRTAQSGLGTGVASDLHTTHRHARCPRSAAVRSK